MLIWETEFLSHKKKKCCRKIYSQNLFIFIMNETMWFYFFTFRRRFYYNQNGHSRIDILCLIYFTESLQPQKRFSGFPIHERSPSNAFPTNIIPHGLVWLYTKSYTLEMEKFVATSTFLGMEAAIEAMTGVPLSIKDIELIWDICRYYRKMTISVY